MRHAEVHEVLYAPGARCLHCALTRSKIHSAEFRRFRRIRMRDSHQLNERVGWFDVFGVGATIQGIAENCVTTRWKFRF